MRQAIAASLLVWQFGCSSNTEPVDPPLSILILPHSTQLHEGELLVCKLTVLNQESIPVRLARPLGDEIGGISWMIRRKGEQQTRILTRWTGMFGGTLYDADLFVQPGQSYVTFDSIFPSRQCQPFVQAGSYEVIAILELDGQKILSRPAEVLVTPVLLSEREAITAAADFLDAVLAYNPPEKEKLTERERKLNPSQLKTTYQWLLAFLATEDATDPLA